MVIPMYNTTLHLIRKSVICKFHGISQRLKMKEACLLSVYLLKIFLESLVCGVFCLTDTSVRPGYFCLSACFFFLLPFPLVLSGIFKSTPVAC